MKMIKVLNYKWMGLAMLGFAVTSCYDRTQKASADNTSKEPGTEYAPQMYHAESYEPLTQVTVEDAGMNHWPYEMVGGGKSDYKDMSGGHGEWYNSNYYNEHGMNMRMPVKGTVAVGKGNYRYNINPDSAAAWTNVASPFQGDSSVVEKGKLLYSRYCQHCHGENGDGKGAVGVVFNGVPNYHTDAYRSRTRGDIYHTISYGRGRMRGHAAQLDPAERWMIAEYIKVWQAEKQQEGN
jgi:mono/diheme cytochrome c family protein